MIQLDPANDWTIGAIGWDKLLYGPPSFEHGWQPRHVSTESTKWSFKLPQRLVQYKDVPAWQIVISPAGRDGLVVESVVLMAGDKTIFETTSSFKLAPGDKKKLSVALTKAELQLPLKVRMSVRASKGNHSYGKINLLPHFPL